ncbi:cupin domain-containing protein [Sulfitobacter sp.]|uniref:cupin domain-containing protein n=1 Tax=Sulfitobacter sp. TaxID=1903071 RepID=UPI0030035AC7
MMKKLLAITILMTLFVPIVASAGQITLLDTNDLSWETTPEGVAFAALQGDRFTESYQALVRLPAGTVIPPHVKTTNMYGVMLQGEMKHYAHGEDPDTASKIGVGSFYGIPAV